MVPPSDTDRALATAAYRQLEAKLCKETLETLRAQSEVKEDEYYCRGCMRAHVCQPGDGRSVCDGMCRGAFCADSVTRMFESMKHPKPETGADGEQGAWKCYACAVEPTEEVSEEVRHLDKAVSLDDNEQVRKVVVTHQLHQEVKEPTPVPLLRAPPGPPKADEEMPPADTPARRAEPPEGKRTRTEGPEATPASSSVPATDEPSGTGEGSERERAPPDVEESTVPPARRNRVREMRPYFGPNDSYGQTGGDPKKGVSRQ